MIAASEHSPLNSAVIAVDDSLAAGAAVNAWRPPWTFSRQVAWLSTAFKKRIKNLVSADAFFGSTASSAGVWAKCHPVCDGGRSGEEPAEG
jgi:hypothetical protein